MEDMIFELVAEQTPILPFLFVLAVVYGLLNITGKSRPGKGFFGKNSVNFVISLVFALFAAGYQPFVTMFYNYFNYILIIFIGLFVFSVFIDILNKKDSGGNGSFLSNNAKEVMILALLGSLSLIYIESENLLRNVPVNEENFIMIVGLAFIAIIFKVAGRVDTTK